MPDLSDADPRVPLDVKNLGTDEVWIGIIFSIVVLAAILLMMLYT